MIYYFEKSLIVKDKDIYEQDNDDKNKYINVIKNIIINKNLFED